MPIRTRLHKPKRDNIVFLAVRALPLGLCNEIAAVNQWSGALALRPFRRVLRHEPFWKPINNHATRRCVRVLAIRWGLPTSRDPAAPALLQSYLGGVVR